MARLAVLLALLLAACGGRPTAQSPPPTGQGYEVTATILERAPHGPMLCLGAIAASLPPQCGDVPLRRFDWSMVAGEQTRSGTTWGTATLRGTYDSEAFTVTGVLDKPTVRAPTPRQPDFSRACATPERTDPAASAAEWDGTPGLDGPEIVAVWLSHGPDVINVVVRPGAAPAVRTTIRAGYGGPLCLVERDQRSRQELHAIQARLTERLNGRLLTASSDEVRGVVAATVIVVTPELQAEVDREFGPGTVELDGRLTPV